MKIMSYGWYGSCLSKGRRVKKKAGRQTGDKTRRKYEGLMSAVRSRVLP